MSTLGSLSTLCLIACNGAPASHFAPFAKALETKGYSVCLYASGPALQKYQELGIEANPFGIDGPLDASAARDLAQRCAQAAVVITDMGHPFATLLQQALKDKAPLALRVVYYGHPESDVPGGFSEEDSKVMRLAQRTLFATPNLAIDPILGLAEEATSSLERPVILSSIERGRWAEACVRRYPEISWLARDDVRNTQEGNVSNQTSDSERLFGQKFIEFDRTLMTLRCLRWLVNGSDEAYREWTADQPPETRLSQESFQRLCRQGERLLESEWGGLSRLQMAQAMETALVLGDMGKSEKARELFKPYGVHAPDHDDFYAEALQVLVNHPHLCPSFSRLPPAAKDLLVKVAHIAHYGHITHLEGDSSMFDKLYQKSLPSTDPMALSFDLFVHTCDVAGALGHVKDRSSLVYTEITHRAMQAMNDAVYVLTDPSKTPQDAYNAYVATRASWLGLGSDSGLDRVSAREGAMLRLFTPAEGKVVKQALEELPSSDRDEIIFQLDVQNKRTPYPTPTYVPAVLVNLSSNLSLGTTREERLARAIQLGLPFICKVLANHPSGLSGPLNFNDIARVAKETPLLLSTRGFTVDEEGNVHLAQQ